MQNDADFFSRMKPMAPEGMNDPQPPMTMPPSQVPAKMNTISYEIGAPRRASPMVNKSLTPMG
jgi:hypothetical protein